MKDIFTVSQLNDNIKDLLEETFGAIWVEGEVSNLRRPQSGHVYFTLKDDKSQIRAVYFRQFGIYRSRTANFDLEEGLKILCRARLSAYPPRGEYQLIIESVEPLGVGALQKAFEQLKTKLAAEGLFDAPHKKELPFLPEKIGIITSPTGAVIKDILNVTRRRFPSIDILIAPVRVQGAEAAAEITAALGYLQKFGSVDVIIIARGGGSLEDIAPFNDEGLARAIFASTIPIVSAVGHETDFTICDFVADLRAPTPSAAAELVVPQRTELLAKLRDLQQRLISGQRRYFEDRKDRLDGLQQRFKDPRRFLMDFQIHLDDLRERMERAWNHKRQQITHQLRILEKNLQHQNPMNQISNRKLLLNNLQKDMLNSWQRLITAHQGRVQRNAALLDSLSPLAVLKRGYSITRLLPEGKIIRQADVLNIHEKVNIQLDRGNFDAKVEKIYGE